MGQRMLGSVANHAWAEDSLYLTHTGRKGAIKMEFESKVAPGQIFKIGNLDNDRWDPQISHWRKDDENQNSRPARDRGARRSSKDDEGERQGSDGSGGKGSRAGDALERLSGIQTTSAIAAEAGLEYQQCYRQLRRDRRVQKTGTNWEMKTE
jgi:hypothetical protein